MGVGQVNSGKEFLLHVPQGTQNGLAMKNLLETTGAKMWRGYAVSQGINTSRLKEVLATTSVADERAVITLQLFMGEDMNLMVVPNANVNDIEKAVMRLHENLNHCAKKNLLRMMHHAGCTKEAIRAAARLQCPVCEETAVPKLQRPRAVPDNALPFSVISFDMKEVPAWRPGEKRQLLGIIDHCSWLHKGAILSKKSPTAKEQRQKFREKWKDPYGAADYAYCDVTRNNVGGEMLRGFEEDVTKLLPIAGEAHWQLSYVERHNGVISNAIEIGLQAVQPQSEEEYIEMAEAIFQAKNRLARRLGHSAFQVALGRDPKMPDSLLDDEVSPATHDLARHDRGYIRSSQIRLQSRIAILKVADNQALRETLATRPRPHREFMVKDCVYYYRRQRSRDLGFWRGPATVIGTEKGNIWVAHSDQVLKCAPEHIRLASPDEKLAPEKVEAILRRAQHALGSGRRGAYQYVDLTQAEYPPTAGAGDDDAPEMTPAEAMVRGQAMQDGANGGDVMIEPAAGQGANLGQGAPDANHGQGVSAQDPVVPAGIDGGVETFREKRARLERGEAVIGAPMARMPVGPPPTEEPSSSSSRVPLPLTEAPPPIPTVGPAQEEEPPVTPRQDDKERKGPVRSPAESTSELELRLGRLIRLTTEEGVESVVLDDEPVGGRWAV